MKEDSKDYFTLGEIINNFRSFGRYLRKRWYMLVLALVAGITLGTVYCFKQKPKYVAITTFILEEKSAGGGGLAGLASQFGFDLGGLTGGGSIFAGDNILDILESRKIIQKVLLSEVENSNKTLADIFLDSYGWKKRWSEVDSLKDINFNSAIEGRPLSRKQDSVLNLVHQYLIKKALQVERVNKKGTIIKVQLQSVNDLFAMHMTNRLVDEASKLYLHIKTGTAQANIDRMQHRSDSLLALLNNKSYRAAASEMLDLNPGISTASVPKEIASRDKAVVATLYTEVTKNLEASKMLLSQQTPIIQVLDEPHLPLVDEKNSQVVVIAIGIFISLLLMTTFLGLKFIFRAGNK